MNAPRNGYTPGTGLPLAPPLGSTNDELSAQVRDEFAQSKEPNTSALTSAEVTTHSRIGKRALQRLDEHLSDRDRRVLARVAEHRFLTTHQLQAFCFDDHTSEASASRTARRVLSRLQRDGLLRALDRRIGGVRAGSAARVWQLAPAGTRVLHGDEARRRLGTPSLRFLAHRLAIADVHLLLRAHLDIEAIEDVTVEVEPAAWRRYQGRSGEPRWLQPDLHAELTTRDFTDRAFIEVDLGTESLPTLLGKCVQYEEYRRSGIEQDRYGSFPIVVWLLTSPERVAKLDTAVRRHQGLNGEMFRYATPDTLAQVLAGDAS